MSKGNPTINLRLTQDQIDRLKAIAAERGISLSALIRMAIQYFLLSENEKPQ